MTQQTELKPRRKTSVYTRPTDLSGSTMALGEHQQIDGRGLQPALEGGGRPRKVSFGSSGRPRNTSIGSMEGGDGGVARTRKQSFNDSQDGNYRNRKISFSRRNLAVDERGWGIDNASSVRGMSATTKPNTYKMNPDIPFREKAVREVIENVLEDMDKVRYDNPILMAGRASSMCDAVKQRVKLLGFDRYKLVCMVCLGQKNGQEVQDVGRCLWDPTKDGFVSVAYENATLFVVVSVYAIYQE